MKNTLLIAILLSILSAACTPQKVDKVPSVTDAHNIKVDNQKISQSKFIKTYCINVDLSNSTEHDVTTCESVKAAAKQDFTKGDRSSGNW